LKLLKNEKSFFIQNLLWGDLKAYNRECPKNILEELIQATDPIVRAGAARILAMKVENPDSSAALKKALSDEGVVRVYLAEGLALRTTGGTELLATLAKDKLVQVRTFVASAKSSTPRVTTHIALTTDVDPEVRRLAVVALRYYKEAAVIDALLKAMNDSYKPTRTAAENSMIFMKISPKSLERIGSQFLTQEPAKFSAVRILGALKDSRFNDKIEEMLNSTSDTDLMRRSINALGAVNCSKAAASVAKKSTCKDELVREAVGNALGIFNIKDTFTTMVKLSSDSKLIVSLAAVKGMGITKDSYFIPTLLDVLKNVKIAPSMRSFACWSLAQIDKPSDSLIQRLVRNATVKIIPVPMAGPDYDADYARIAAVLTLVKFAKKNDKAKQTVLKILKKLRTPREQQLTFISGPTLQEYARQADLYMQKKAIAKVPLPTANPSMTLKKYVKK
jgi:HEAT repeat protein